MSLRPKMMKLVDKVESLIPAYFTENPVNIDDWWGIDISCVLTIRTKSYVLVNYKGI